MGHAFLVMIKLDPMATVPDTARARPMYLSSSMKDLVGGEEEDVGESVAGREYAMCDSDDLTRL